MIPFPGTFRDSFPAVSTPILPTKPSYESAVDRAVFGLIEPSIERPYVDRAVFGPINADS